MRARAPILAAVAIVIVWVAGCTTAPPVGTLTIDARPESTYIAVLDGTTTVHAGYGDVTLSGLKSGSYLVLEARGERSKSVTVSVAPGGSTRVDAHVTQEDDSDQPVWAGRNGDHEQTPGGGMQGSDTRQGDLFGDLYVLLRNANGEPITITIAGVDYVQPLAFYADANGEPAEPVTDLAGDPVPLALGAEGTDFEGEIISPQYYPPDTGALVVPKEIDLGRLNEVRAPDNVLDRAYDEAMANLASSVKPITQDPMGRLEYWTDDVTPVAIDSPLENLALYRALMLALEADDTGGLVIVGSDGGTLLDTHLRPADARNPADPADPRHVSLDYAAAMLAAAADKTGDIDVDVAITINTFLGINGLAEPDYFDLMGYGHVRADHFGDEEATVLQPVEGDPTLYRVTTINLFDRIFGARARDAQDAVGFADAADDDLTVLEYVHNYLPPEAL